MVEICDFCWFLVRVICGATFQPKKWDTFTYARHMKQFKTQNEAFPSIHG